MVPLGAQLHDRRAEQPPLHAALDLQRRVGGDELLERGDVAAIVLEPADGDRERAMHRTVFDEQMELGERALPLLFERQAIPAVQCRVLHELASFAPHVAPRAHEQVVQNLHVDGCGGTLRCGGTVEVLIHFGGKLALRRRCRHHDSLCSFQSPLHGRSAHGAPEMRRAFSTGERPKLARIL